MGLYNPASVNVTATSNTAKPNDIKSASIDVTSTPTNIMPADSARNGFIIFNDSSVDTIQLFTGTGSTTGKKIINIEPKGSYFDEYNYIGSLAAKSLGGAVIVQVTEFITST